MLHLCSAAANLAVVDQSHYPLHKQGTKLKLLYVLIIRCISNKKNTSFCTSFDAGINGAPSPTVPRACASVLTNSMPASKRPARMTDGDDHLPYIAYRSHMNPCSTPLFPLRARNIDSIGAEFPTFPLPKVTLQHTALSAAARPTLCFFLLIRASHNSVSQNSTGKPSQTCRMSALAGKRG